VIARLPRHEACLMNVENDPLDVVAPKPDRADGTAKLIVIRPRQFADMLRFYDIVVDGKRAASIRPGQKVELELAPGCHEISARLDWFGSRPVRIKVASQTEHHLEVGNNSLSDRLPLAILMLWIAWPFLAAIVGLTAWTLWGDPFELPVFGLTVSVIVSFLPPVLLVVIACVTHWRGGYLYLRQNHSAISPFPASRPSLKWRPRLSVRALMLAVLVIGGVLGLVLHRARVQHEAVIAIQEAGGSVCYHWQRIGNYMITGPTSPTWWDSFMARLGPDMFGRVVWVGFNGNSTAEPDDALLAQISQIRSLEELDFRPLGLSKPGFASHRSVTDAGLVHLRNLPRLRRLNLSRTGVRGPGLVHLRGMKQLRWLELLELPLGDDDLSHLEGLTSLEILNLSSDRITDAGLAHLAGLTNLHQLQLESPWITTAGLRHVSGMTQLSGLVLNSPRIDSLRPLDHLTSLWWLSLRDTAIGDDDMAIIGRFKALFDLQLSHTRISDSGMVHLAGLSQVVVLDLSDTRITDAGLTSLIGLKKCNYVGLYGTGVTDQGVALLSMRYPAAKIFHGQTSNKKAILAQVRESRNPKELNLSDPLLQDDDLIELGRLNSLEKLCLRSDGITDAGLTHVEGFTNLKSLKLASRSITSAGLRCLRGMTRLHELTLTSPGIGSLVDLQHLTGLKALHLDDTSIGDDGLAIVARFKDLEALTLADTKIGDAGLAHLAALGKLAWLDLGATSITDAGLPSLSGLSQCQHLDVKGTAVTPAGVASLLARYPKLQINR
jgi:internalin A